MRGLKGIAGMARSSGGAPAALLALVLLFRLLVPTGYMIAPDQSGRPGLVICGVGAGIAVAHKQGHGHVGHKEAPAPAKPGELPCAFAAVAAPPLPPAPPILPPPAPAAESPRASASLAIVARPALAAPPPPATGPPTAV